MEKINSFIFSVNVKPEVKGERGIPKEPVGLAKLTLSGFEGDFNRHRFEELSFTTDQAVLILPYHVITDLNREGYPVDVGHLGENLTVKGIRNDEVSEGQIYSTGNAVIQISKRCLPCKNLKVLPYFSRGVNLKELLRCRRGWYARVIQQGRVEVGDSFFRVDY